MSVIDQYKTQNMWWKIDEHETTEGRKKKHKYYIA